MKKYLNSAYVKKRDLSEEVNDAISKDLKLFNKLKRCTFSRACAGKAMNHKTIKSDNDINDYFVTAVEGAVKMIVSSQKKLLSGYIDDIKEDICSMNKKQEELKQRKASLQRMKESIVSFTKGGGKDLSVIRNFKSSAISFKNDGRVTVGFAEHIREFSSIFEFEHTWLEPKIQRLGAAEKNVRSAIRRKQQQLDIFTARKDTGDFSVYFGGRKLMNDTSMPPEQRKKEIRRRRDGSMTLSGRSDAACGNFMVHYIPETGELLYRGSDHSMRFLSVGRVTFPRKGADRMIEDAFKERTPKAWVVEDCGNAWRFNLILTLPDIKRNNDFYQDGCIGIDINSGFLAYTETDGCGNPVSRGVIHFPMNGRSSGQNRQAISEALEAVFRIALSKNKPISAEDIGATERKVDRYSTSHRGNRSRSLFPSALCRQLMESKSRKYGIAVTFVNPAYTSQIGKVKYMGRYGMSIHEAASLTIARRGMGFSERLPDSFRKCLDPKPEKKPPVKTTRAVKAGKTNRTDDPASGTDNSAAPVKKSLPLIQRRRIFHWKAAYPETCKLSPVDIYRDRHSEKKNNTQTV